ncbi:MAG: dTDP-4-dehydrorhamnose 3,5-epimerase family protein [Pyrinomonadaceae bacterium]
MKNDSGGGVVPRLLEGGLGVDDRGSVAFVNDFNFAGVKRFYLVTNHRAGFVRAWHAHRLEAKYVTVTRGAAVVAAVRIDNWESPSADGEVHRYVLSAQKPSVLYIPAGYANGFMSLTEDATLMFFSTSTLEESRGDDVRYDARHWNIWNVVER